MALLFPVALCPPRIDGWKARKTKEERRRRRESCFEQTRLDVGGLTHKASAAKNYISLLDPRGPHCTLESAAQNWSVQPVKQVHVRDAKEGEADECRPDAEAMK